MESDTDNKSVTFYPTYGFKQDGQWVIPIRLWVSKPRSLSVRRHANHHTINLVELISKEERCNVATVGRNTICFCFS